MKRNLRKLFVNICLIVSSLVVLVGCGKGDNQAYYNLNANVTQPENVDEKIIYGQFKDSISKVEKGKATYYEVYIPAGYSSNNLKVKLNNTELSYESSEKYVDNENGNYNLVTSFSENDELKYRIIRYEINNINSDSTIEVDASLLKKTKLNISYDFNSSMEFYEEVKEPSFENSTSKIKTIDLLKNSEYYKKLTINNKKVSFEYGSSIIAKFNEDFIENRDITLNKEKIYFKIDSNYSKIYSSSLTSKVNNELKASEEKEGYYYADSFTIDFYNSEDKDFVLSWYTPTTSSENNWKTVEINGKTYTSTISTGPGSGREPYVNSYSQKEGYRGALMYVGEDTIEESIFELKYNDIVSKDELLVFEINPLFGSNYGDDTIQKIYNNTKVKLGNNSITLTSSNSKIANKKIYVWFSYNDIKDLVKPEKLFTYYSNNTIKEAMAVYGGAMLDVKIDRTNLKNIYSLDISKDELSNKYIDVSIDDSYYQYTPLETAGNKKSWLLNEETNSTSTQEVTLKVKFPSFYDYSNALVSAVITNNSVTRTENLSVDIINLMKLYHFDVTTFKETSNDQLMSDTIEIYSVVSAIYDDTSNLVAYKTSYGYKLTKNEGDALYYYVIKIKDDFFVYTLDMKAEDCTDYILYDIEWEQVNTYENKLDKTGLFSTSTINAISNSLELKFKVNTTNNDTIRLRYSGVVKKNNPEKKKLDFSDIYKDPNNSEIEFYILKDLEGNTNESDMVLDSSDKWIHVTSSNYESVEILTSSNNELYMYVNIDKNLRRMYYDNEFKENFVSYDYYSEDKEINPLKTYVFDEVKVTKDNKEFTLFNIELKYDEVKEHYVNNNAYEVKTFVIIK